MPRSSGTPHRHREGVLLPLPARQWRAAPDQARRRWDESEESMCVSAQACTACTYRRTSAAKFHALTSATSRSWRSFSILSWRSFSCRSASSFLCLADLVLEIPLSLDPPLEASLSCAWTKVQYRARRRVAIMPPPGEIFTLFFVTLGYPGSLYAAQGGKAMNRILAALLAALSVAV